MIELKDFLLISVGIITGFINTVAGGGSVIILPVLILYFGLPVQIANGTNRIGILMQSIFSAIGFKSKQISPLALGTTKSLLLAAVIMLGAIIGANIAIDFPDYWFNKVLSVIMLVVLILTIWKPKPTTTWQQGNRGYWVSIVILFFVGIYAGFIQAGTGFLLILCFSYFNGLSLVASNALKTVVVFLLTVGALYIFISDGQVNLKYGFLLAIGNAIGGYTASRWSVKKGDKTIQIFMIVAVSIMAIKLCFY